MTADKRASRRVVAAELREFLPAAEALLATPFSLGGRRALWAICLLCALVLAWAWWARLDIVVQAPGRVVVAGHNRAMQVSEPATVVAVHVIEGQRVAQRQLLLALDDSVLLADRHRLAAERQQLTGAQAARAAVLACSQRAACRLPVGLGVSSPDEDGDVVARFHAQWTAYQTALAGLEEEARQKRALLAASTARLPGLSRTAALLSEETAALAALQQRGMLPRVQWMARERERLAAVDALETARGSLQAGDAELATLAARRETVIAQFVERTLAEQLETDRRLHALASELARVDRSLAGTRLYAPVAGRVQGLVTQTPGGVVAAGVTLLEIVPDAAPRMVEALVGNRDIGLVRLGLPVVVKADAFNFTRYGTVAGRVARLAADAAEGPDRQLRFNTGIALDAPGLRIDGQEVPFTPGMTVTVEFALGQRRALDFLLGPLRRYRDESAREP